MFCVLLRDNNKWLEDEDEIALFVGPFKEEQTAKDFAQDVTNVSGKYTAEVKPLASLHESFNFLNGIKKT